jgi:thioredoxin reductase (NADPH)
LLRRYTDDLSLLTLGKALQMPAREQEALRQAGVRIIDDPIAELSIERDRLPPGG